METIIVISKKSQIELEFPKEISLIIKSGEEEALGYQLEHPDIDGYYIDTQDLTPFEVSDYIENIHYLNSMTPIFLKESDQHDYTSLKQENRIFVIREFADLKEQWDSIPRNKRKSNRIDWPVLAEYKTNWESREQTGLILSLSRGGCFIQTTRFPDEGEEITLTIKFRDFHFLSEGSVVRVQKEKDPKGMAIQFHEVTPQTSQLMESIINEKILKKIMDRVLPQQGEGGNL